MDGVSVELRKFWHSNSSAVETQIRRDPVD